LAELSLQWRQRADALRLTTQALQADSKNEIALRVLARGSVQDGNFAAALSAVDKLGGGLAPSAAALTDSGEVLSQLAQAVTRKQASIGIDADALTHRAKEAYERALSLDGDYLRSWAGLANLYASQRAVEAARALVPRAEPVLEKHPKSAALAQALAGMCAQTGQAHGAFLFGEHWRSYAVSQEDLDHAVAFIAWLKTLPAHP
jgi:Tfp pilus assembly protein PilF